MNTRKTHTKKYKLTDTKKKKKFCVIGFALILLGRIGIIELYALPHKQTNKQLVLDLL